MEYPRKVECVWHIKKYDTTGLRQFVPVTQTNWMEMINQMLWRHDYTQAGIYHVNPQTDQMTQKSYCRTKSNPEPSSRQNGSNKMTSRTLETCFRLEIQDTSSKIQDTSPSWDRSLSSINLEYLYQRLLSQKPKLPLTRGHHEFQWQATIMPEFYVCFGVIFLCSLLRSSVFPPFPL